MRLPRMRKTLLPQSLLVIALLGGALLAACAPKPAATVAPSTPLEALKAHPWQWVGFTNPVDKFKIDNPQSYQITFNADGKANVVADCNNAILAYTADDSSLKFQPGPMTMAACPPGSRSNDFVQYLSFAAIYFFKDGNLFIDLFADGGTLEFKPAG